MSHHVVPKLSITGVQKSFSNSDLVLDRVNYTFSENGVSSLMGASGCGKTTLLKIIAGLIDADQGSIDSSCKRPFYSSQNPLLLPWLTVRENAMLPLTLKGDQYTQSTLEDDELDSALDSQGLLRFGSYYPHELSGGMIERVVLTQMSIFKPDLILLDEPLSSNDISRKASLLNAMKPLLASLKARLVYVTHDIHEALALGGELVILGPPPYSIKQSLELPSSVASLQEALLDSSLTGIKADLLDLLYKYSAGDTIVQGDTIAPDQWL